MLLFARIKLILNKNYNGDEYDSFNDDCCC